MNTKIIKETIDGSINGTMIFPKVVELLLGEGVEAYHVDLIRGENRYYWPNGESHMEKMELQYEDPARNFSAEKVAASIKQVQAGQSNYKRFIKEITEAGCVYYMAYLDGKRVVYLGRKGEMHIELFPQQK